MIRELILSVASGVIVAVILQMFGGRRHAPAPRPNARHTAYAAPRRRSFFGRVLRLVLSVAGGIAFAQAAAPFVLRRRFDRFDGFDGLTSHAPIMVLTVAGTIIIWMFLSVLTRR